MVGAPRFENRRQRRKRRRATRRRQERMAAKHARQNSRSRVDDADSDTSNSSSCDEGPVVGRAFLGGAPTGRPQHNHHQTLGDEVRTFRQMVERGNAMKRLERAMRLLGLQLERAHFEHCTVQEIRLVTARYNRHNKASTKRTYRFSSYLCLSSCPKTYFPAKPPSALCLTLLVLHKLGLFVGSKSSESEARSTYGDVWTAWWKTPPLNACSARCVDIANERPISLQESKHRLRGTTSNLRHFESGR